VLIACSYFERNAGGLQRFVEDTAQTLAGRHGDDVMVLAATAGAAGVHPWGLDMPRGSVVLHRVRGRVRDPRSLSLPIAIHTVLPGVRRIVRSFDPDVVHLTHDRWFLPNFELAIAAGGRPLVASPFLHPYRTNLTNFPQTLVNRATLRIADRVTAVTRYEATHLTRLYGVKEGQLAIFPQGVRGLADPRPAPRSGRSTVLFVGRLDPVKGARVAAEAFCRGAPSLPPDSRFVAVGRDWGELGAVRERMGGAGLLDRFDHLEAVSESDLTELYDRAIACVLPSKVGAFGYPIFEALARGTPVITTATPQSQELLTAGGILVEGPRTDAFSEALVALAADEQSWSRLSRDGYALAATRFTAERMVQGIRDQYKAAGAT